MRLAALASVLFVCTLSTGGRQSSADAAVQAVAMSRAYQQARDVLTRDLPRLVTDTIALTEVPSPPHGEDARALAVLQLFKSTRLTRVERDAVGNVTALRPGRGGPLVVISAHLDTVFPAGTDVHVTRDGTRLSAPGIGDDSQALALLVALARAMDAAGVQTTSDILFAATVGEEGVGDLRGVRYLFTAGPYRDRIKTFISIDGAGDGTAITATGIGSRRYRVTYRGPGGHSYSSFGVVNPALALANAMQAMSALKVSNNPKSTYNVGTIGGGTSVNAIPSEAWMEVELRSESTRELARLDAELKTLVDRAAVEENRTRSTAEGRVTAEMTSIGSRPTGQTSEQSRVVQTALAATRALHLQPLLTSASTDANVPMSLGVPAITIDSGIPGGRAHAPDEWIDVEPRASARGLARTLLIVLSIAGLSE